MALILSNLITGLNNMSDDVTAPGESIGVEITNFTNGLLPLVNPAVKSSADSTFINSLNLASNVTPLPPILTAAMTTYVSTLATGMQPLFTSTPPPSTLITIDIFSAPQSKTQFATLLANRIYNYMITGTAVNNNSSVVVNWS